MLVVCFSETIVVFLFTIMINEFCILERAMYRPLCLMRKLGEPKFLNLQWNGYNEWPVPDMHDDIMAFMDLHHGHVDLIKEIQTVLTKRAKLWDLEPALVYLYTGDGQNMESWRTLGLKPFIRAHLHWRLRALNSSVNFFVNFVMASQSGDNPQEDIAKFSYNLNMEVHFLRTSFYIFWLHTWTRYRNLVIFLIFWSNFGYWKSQKVIDFYTINFLYVVFWWYIVSKKKGCSRVEIKNPWLEEKVAVVLVYFILWMNA